MLFFWTKNIIYSTTKLNSKSCFQHHVTLKTGVMAVENSDLPSQEKWILKYITYFNEIVIIFYNITVFTVFMIKLM